MKKILITGSNGLLGQKLVDALVLRPGFEVHASSLGPNRRIQREGYQYHELDITDKAAVGSLIQAIQPDVVINTAAMTNVDACETKREECWKLNVDAVRYLVEALEEQMLSGNVPQLIQLSTDFIFDGTKGAAYVETDEPNPLGYYALSKLESEHIVAKSKLRWAIARTVIVYGVVDHMSRSNIVLWAKDALAKGQQINVVDDQFRSPTLAEDLAQGCVLMVEKGATGIYNISGKEVLSILDLVYRVADFWKLDRSLITPSKSDSLKQAAKRPPRTGFIIDKAMQELGYHPHSLEEGFELLQKQLQLQSI